MAVKRDDLGLEQALARLQPVADPEFEIMLRRQLMAEYSNRTWYRNQRSWQLFGKWAAIAAAVLLAIILLTPAGRAMAQQILHLGIFRITAEPSVVERMVAEPSMLEAGNPSTVVRVGLTDASAQAGFEVYFPNYLPPGYQPQNNPPLELIVGGDEQVRAVEVMFADDASGDLLFFSQQLFPPEEELSLRDFPDGETAFELIEVGSLAGLWLPDHPWGSRLDESGNPEVVPYNVLIWIQPADDGSYYFWLGSQAKLPKEELLRIARSISAAP